MKNLTGKQQGFITLILMLLIILVTVIVFVYTRVEHSHTNSGAQVTNHFPHFM